jgi:hypothetical protein
MITVNSPLESVVEEQSKTWKPTLKQERFLAVPFDVDEAGYGGALMAGKSDVLMLMPLIYQFHENPRFKGLFLRRTFPELEQEIIPRSQEYYPSTGATYNIGRHRWEWPNGAMDTFGHLKDEKDVKKYDTGQFPLIRWDEATSFTGFQYEYITIRRNRAPVGSGLPSFTRWGSNPGNVGHVYFRKRFIDPCKTGGKIIHDKRTGSKRIFIPATAEDNPHAREENPKYFKRLNEITSEAERRAMILGDWYTFEGQVFEEFRLEPLINPTRPDLSEPDNARHVVESFKIPSWWPRLISIDWGMKAYTFIIWWAISPEGRVFIYRCYAVKKVKIRQWARDMAQLTDYKEQVRDIGICFSANQDRGQDQTIYEQIAEALSESGFNCSLTLGDRNRVGGKQLVHEYLRWKPLPSIKQIIGDYDTNLASKIERMHGSKALEEYVKYFAPEEPEYNLPKLQIFAKDYENISECNTALDLLIECIPACVYDEVKKEDVKEFDGDDPYDCLRIGLYRLRDYFGEATNEQAKLQKIGMAAKVLEQTNDQTAFYRACEHAEALERKDFSIRKQGRRFGSMSSMSRFGRAARH